MRRFLAPAGAVVHRGERPSFSVVLPAYHAAESIAEADEPALVQPAPPLEIVLSADGSTDGIKSALRQYRDRVVLLRRPHRGVSAARNAALEVVRGDFVANLDADDVFLPERLEALGDLAMAHPGLLATDAWFKVGGRRQGRFNGLKRLPGRRSAGGVPRYLRFVLSPAVRRERLLAVGGLDESLACAEDWDCWAPVRPRERARVALVDEALYVSRLGEGSLTADHPQSLRSRVVMLDKVAARHDIEAGEVALVLYASRPATPRGAARRGGGGAALVQRGRTTLRPRGVTGPAFGPATRAKATVAALVPALAARVLDRRAQGQEMGAARSAPGHADAPVPGSVSAGRALEAGTAGVLGRHPRLPGRRPRPDHNRVGAVADRRAARGRRLRRGVDRRDGPPGRRLRRPRHLPAAGPRRGRRGQEGNRVRRHG